MFSRNALYKSTFYLLTYLLTYYCVVGTGIKVVDVKRADEVSLVSVLCWLAKGRACDQNFFLHQSLWESKLGGGQREVATG